MSFEPQSRAAILGAFWLDKPWDTWTAARHRVFERRQILYWALVATFVVLLALIVERRDDWVALVFGALLIPVATELTCYYYAFLALFALLWVKAEWVGVSLCAVTALTLIVPAALTSDDDIFTSLSAIVLLYVLALTLHSLWTLKTGTKVTEMFANDAIEAPAR